MEESNIGFELKIVTNMIKRCVDKSFGNKITHTQLFLLNYINMCNEKGEMAFQKDIEHIFEIRRSTVSELLNTMEKNGFIKRVDSDRESKLKQIVLDTDGTLLVKEFKTHIKEIHNQIIKNISKEDLEIFSNVIKKIKENVEEIC